MLFAPILGADAMYLPMATAMSSLDSGIPTLPTSP
jgi:hypothetical protein